MNKRILWTTATAIAIFFLAMAFVTPVSADQSVTVTVLDSQGNAIPSVLVQFSQNNFNTYVSATTGLNGIASKTLADGTWKVRALYHNTSAIQELTSNSIVFYTSQSQARVYKHDGTTAFPGVLVRFSPSSGFGTYVSATTDGTGFATAELFPGTIYLRASISGTSADQNMVLAGDNTTAGQSSLVTFYTSQSQAQVYKHDGAAFPGVLVRFSPSSGFGTYVSATTDGSGFATAELFPGTVYLRASISGTSADQSMALAGDSTTFGQSSLVTFYTSESKALVQDCSASNIAGVRIQFFHDGTHGTYVSINTDANGVASTELFPGSHDMQASINHTAQLTTYTLAGDGKTAGQSTTTTFTPTKLVFTVSPVHYWIGYWTPFTSPGYMFPATVKFRLGGAGGLEVNVNVSGCGGQFAAIKLIDSTGDGLAGGVVTHKSSGGGHDEAVGTTDANGLVTALLPTYVTKVSMDWDPSLIGNWTRRETKDLGPIPLVFQTVKAEVRFATCVGDVGIPGVNVNFKPRSNMQLFGTTDPNGVASREIFAGNYDLEIPNYNWARSATITGHSFPGLATFQTTKVSINYANSVQYMGAAYTGAWRTYTNPMELLPGNYTFRFKTGPGNNDWSPSVPLVVSGCEMSKYLRIVELRDSSGNLITNSGATITYQPNSTGSYISFGDGNLDASGQEFALVDASGTNRYHLTYLGATQEKQSGSATVTYQTQNVTVELRNSGGNYITGSGATVMWQSNGTVSYVQFGNNADLQVNGYTSMEVLPLSNRYHLTYLGATQEKQSSSTTVTYQTQLVTVELRDGSNDLVTGNSATITWQPGSAGSYVQFGSNTDLQANGYTSMEVLPLTNRYRMTNGTTKEKQSGSTTVTYYQTDFP